MPVVATFLNLGVLPIFNNGLSKISRKTTLFYLFLHNENRLYVFIGATYKDYGCDVM